MSARKKKPTVKQAIRKAKNPPPRGARHTYEVLAEYSDWDTGRNIFVGQRRVAKRIGTGLRAVQYHYKVLFLGRWLEHQGEPDKHARAKWEKTSKDPRHRPPVLCLILATLDDKPTTVKQPRPTREESRRKKRDMKAGRAAHCAGLNSEIRPAQFDTIRPAQFDTEDPQLAADNRPSPPETQSTSYFSSPTERKDTVRKATPSASGGVLNDPNSVDEQERREAERREQTEKIIAEVTTRYVLRYVLKEDPDYRYQQECERLILERIQEDPDGPFRAADRVVLVALKTMEARRQENPLTMASSFTWVLKRMWTPFLSSALAEEATGLYRDDGGWGARERDALSRRLTKALTAAGLDPEEFLE